MKLIAPSVLSADFSKLGDEVREVERAGADWIHLDVMDGHFVPNLTIGPIIVEAVKRVTGLPLDVHLMIDNPDDFLDDFAEAGADYIAVHAEVLPHLHRTLSRIRELGVHPAVVLNPSTPLVAVEPVLDMVDMVLLMSVNPGFGGQSFIESVLPKLSALKKMIDDAGLNVLVEIDGGVAPDTIGRIKAADVFVAGSAIFGREDRAAAIAALRSELD